MGRMTRTPTRRPTHTHTHTHTFSFSGPCVIGSATRDIDPLPFHSKTLARSLISISSLSSRKRAALIVPVNLPGLNEFDRFAYLAIAAHLNRPRSSGTAVSLVSYGTSLRTVYVRNFECPIIYTLLYNFISS